MSQPTPSSESGPRWLEWARDLQSISQAGVSFSEDPNDQERFRSIQRIAAEIVASHAELPAARVMDLFPKDVGWVTPKVAVRSVVFQQDEILLVRELRHGRWTMPGGLVGVNETLREAVIRETYEESGFDVQPRRLLAIYPAQNVKFHRWFTVFIACDTVRQHPLNSHETSETKFFNVGRLPDLAFPDGESQIGNLYRLNSDLSLGAEFE